MAVKVGVKYIEVWKESMEDEILAYEKEPVIKNQIVLYGPSNFTRWSARFGMKPVREVLLGKSGAECVINRGFGSSTAEHHLYYYSRMIRPLEPRVLVYHCGIPNGRSFGYSEEETWEIGQRVVAWAEADFPGIQIYLCGMNPRLKERNYCELESCKRIKGFLSQFAAERENRHYIDVLSYEPLVSRKDIYAEDGDHFNQDGYDIYANLFREALKSELDKY